MTRPEDTVAVVVGIEHYPGGAFPGVSGPALDACRMATWLESRGVPRRNVVLLLAPLPANLPDVERRRPAGFRQATRGAVELVFREELGDLPGSTLVVFWAGHGYQDTRGHRLLVPAGAGVAEFGVGELCGWLGSEAIKLDDQWLFIDACRQHGDSHGITNGSITFPALRASGRQRLRMLSAAPIGAESALIAAEHTSAFSKALLTELRARERDWLPDVGELADRLPSYDHLVTPVATTWRDARGRGGTVMWGRKPKPSPGQDERPATPEPPKPVPVRADPVLPKVEIARLLSAVPKMDDPERRRTLLGRLREKFGSFPEVPDAAPINALVEELSRIEDGWSTLREVVREDPQYLFYVEWTAVRRLRAYLNTLPAGKVD